MELDYLKNSILAISGGSVGQQLRANQILLRAISDQKLKLADADGLLMERRDVMIGPFANDLMHLFPPLHEWMKAEQETLRQMIKDQVGI